MTGRGRDDPREIVRRRAEAGERAVPPAPEKVPGWDEVLAAGSAGSAVGDALAAERAER